MTRYNSALNRFMPMQAGGDSPIPYVANGAIRVMDGVAVLTKPTAGAFTLAAPAASDDGMELRISSRTAGPHTVTIPEGFGGLSNIVHAIVTFTQAGDTITLAADGGHWVPIGAPYGATIEQTAY